MVLFLNESCTTMDVRNKDATREKCGRGQSDKYSKAWQVYDKSSFLK